MDRAGNLNDTSRASDVPSTSYDEKPENKSESSADSIRSQPREDGEDNAQQEKDQHVTEGDNELEPVKSKQPSVNHVASIPNGGLMAWLQVLGAFFLFFNSWYVHPVSLSVHL